MFSMDMRKGSFANFSILYTALGEYSREQNERNLRNILSFMNVGMPLSSGRYGNALAVALEMQQYRGALFMIKNASELGIDLGSISSELGGDNHWDAARTFEFSLSYFDFTKIEENDEFYKDYPEVRKIRNDNIDAAQEIAELLQQPKRN